MSGRADDQDVKVIENRVEVYRSKTEPLADYFRTRKVSTRQLMGWAQLKRSFERICVAVDTVKQ
jgi:adenylate kinase family enzyme